MNPSMDNITDPRQNQLLAALPAAEWERLEGQLEAVDLALGQVVCESCAEPSHVTFPTTAVVSLICMTRDGGTAEVAVVGSDGVVGVPLLMGGDATANRAVVQNAGLGYRLRAQVLKDEVRRGGPVLAMLLRYTQSMVTQMTQTALCNRYHSVDQQVCRRLLMGLDQSSCDELVMTHELVATLLGVRRESVTTAALKLQQAGVIRYWRGHIAVLDRRRLEQRACECYAAARPACYHPLTTALAA